MPDGSRPATSSQSNDRPQQPAASAAATEGGEESAASAVMQPPAEAAPAAPAADQPLVVEQEDEHEMELEEFLGLLWSLTRNYETDHASQNLNSLVSSLKTIAQKELKPNGSLEKLSTMQMRK